MCEGGVTTTTDTRCVWVNHMTTFTSSLVCAWNLSILEKKQSHRDVVDPHA